MLQICELLKMCATYGDYFLLLGLLPLPSSKKTQLRLNEEFESFCYLLFFISWQVNEKRFTSYVRV